MARPREFDEGAVLDAAVLCFWKQGYEATSVRDLVEHTGITAASLYNAFGDKRELYEKALKHYVEENIADRIRRCQLLPPLQAIGVTTRLAPRCTLSWTKRELRFPGDPPFMRRGQKMTFPLSRV
jgi:AcrR family transcriptional regulator